MMTEHGMVGESDDGAPGVYALILDAVDSGALPPGTRLVETDLARRFGVSRTPVREALTRLEAQGVAAIEGRRLVVARLDHDQLGELYAVRIELEAMAGRLAARHADPEEIRVLREMVDADRELLDDGAALARTNKRFHRQLHLASHNRYLLQMLERMRLTLALLSSTTLALPARRPEAIAEHDRIIAAIEARDEAKAEAEARRHISNAYATRLRLEARTAGGAGPR